VNYCYLLTISVIVFSKGAAMLRKILPLMFLLIIVSSDTAQGWRHGRRCRRIDSSCVPCRTRADNYCLQYKYEIFATGDDLYDALVYEGGCQNDPEPHDDLFFGTHNDPLVQFCDEEDDDHDCESARAKGGLAKGHENIHPPFGNKTATCAWLRKPAASCKYIKLVHRSFPQDYYAVVYQLPAGGRFDYFGVETKLFPNPPDPIEATPTVRNPHQPRPAVLYFKDLNNRTYVIWMRKG
jgi:hypothetical protein